MGWKELLVGPFLKDGELTFVLDHIFGYHPLEEPLLQLRVCGSFLKLSYIQAYSEGITKNRFFRHQLDVL